MGPWPTWPCAFLSPPHGCLGPTEQSPGQPLLGVCGPCPPPGCHSQLPLTSDPVTQAQEGRANTPRRSEWPIYELCCPPPWPECEATGLAVCLGGRGLRDCFPPRPRSLWDFPVFVPRTSFQASGQVGTWEFPHCLPFFREVGYPPLLWLPQNVKAQTSHSSPSLPLVAVFSVRGGDGALRAGCHLLPPSWGDVWVAPGCGSLLSGV